MVQKLVLRGLIVAFLIVTNIGLGTAWHEIVGHGLVGVACGGRIAEIVVLGAQLWPSLSWVGTGGAFGTCDVIGVNAGFCEHFWLLTGSLSTCLVSAVALVLLVVGSWKPKPRILLLCLSFWWIDLFTYTLPSLGLRRYVFFGRRHAEPFEAALSLGIPGILFQILTYGFCLILAIASVRQLRKTLARQTPPATN